jgi:predicted nucleic acid-binding protein
LVIGKAVTPHPFGVAIGLVRRLDLGLTVPDALNIAIAHLSEANLLAFDGKMARSARCLGRNAIG